jgi:hypothetical protein
MKTLSALVISVAMFGSVDCRGDQTAAQLCAMDLEIIPGFLLENDTGAKVHAAQFGQKHFDDAFLEAQKSAAQAPDASACDIVLRRYLKAWRKGHLGLQSLNPTPVASDAQATSARAARISDVKEPQLRELSRQTMLLTLSSFANQHRAQLVALLTRHHKELAKHRNWIIDVRGNGGGSDSSYQPLLPWLLPDETATVGAEWLSTPANIRGQEQVCAQFAPGDVLCEKEAKTAVTRMRSVATGQYISQDDSGVMQFERVGHPERRRPSRVAILVDGRCASSCEEFALVARQSFSVKLVGRSTFGSLDYSNLRPHNLPSGQRVLWYATSRSLRLPDNPVDLAGIPPDVYLPAPADNSSPNDDIERVKQWLEGGSLAPTKAAPVKE